MNTTTSENKIKPGYKKTPVGIIPEDWDFDRITSISELIHGFQFRKSHYEENGKYGVIKIGNLSYSGNIIIDSMDYTNATDVNNYERLFLKKGDILMALTGGTLGKVSVFNLENEKYLQNYRVGKFKPINDSNQKFLAYVLQSYIVQKRIEDHVNEAAQPNFGKADFDKIKLPIPPLPEQKAIADCLSTWDKGIEKLTALIQSKKEQKKGLMQQIFSGQLKVDNEQLIQAKKGEDFLKDWKKVRINEISKLGRGRVISKKEIESNLGIYPVYSSQTTNNGVFGYLNTYDFEGEYITWTTDGVNAGSVFYRTGRFNCTNVCGTVKLKKGYDYYFVKSALNRVAERYVSRTLANPKLMNGVFGTIEIMIPSYDEQRSITKVLMGFDKEIELLEKKLDRFKTQKKGLMQVLLTGEKRLLIDSK